MYVPSSLEQLPSSPTITRPIVYKVAHTRNKTNKQQKQITKNNSNKQTNKQTHFRMNSVEMKKFFVNCSHIKMLSGVQISKCCQVFTYQNIVRCSHSKMLSGVHIAKCCQVLTYQNVVSCSQIKRLSGVHIAKFIWLLNCWIC
jgi:(p)ppGpp synthase/HD superfamily hydrolase